MKSRTISQKITQSIIIIALCSSLIIGLIGITTILIISNNTQAMYEQNITPLKNIYQASANFSNVRVMMRNILLKNGDISKLPNDIETSFITINNELKEYEKGITTEVEKENYAEIQKAVEGYSGLKDNFLKLIKDGKENEAKALLNGAYAQELSDGVTNAFDINISEAADRFKTANLLLTISIVAFILLIAAFVIVSIFWGRRISRSISEPINQMVSAANEIAVGNLNVSLNVDTNDETKILSESLKKIVSSLQLLNSDIELLVKAADEGEIDIRTDATKHEGSYKGIIEGVNSILDTVAIPIAAATQYSVNMSNGVHQSDLDNKYKGVFKNLVDSLNATRNALEFLVAESSRLAIAGAEGKLSERGDESKLKGGFANIIKLMNEMLDSIQNPLDVATDYVKKMAAGDELEVIENQYNGTYGELIEGLGRVRTALYALLGEAGKLSEAGKSGQLDIRGNEALVEGGYRQIISGFNETLDAVILPINEANMVLGKLSVNDYTTHMSDGYNGMLNELAVSINHVRERLISIQNTFIDLWHGDTKLYDAYVKIGKRSENDQMIPSAMGMMEAIMSLISESNRLAEAALAGDLSARGNENSYEGGYRKIIEGFNKTLVAISEPIEESSQVLSDLSQGNLTVRMTADYRGEYNRMKTSINHTIDSFNELLGEINSSASQVSAGSKQVSDASQMLAQGATEQASTIEELTSSITEISRQTKENAKHALNANELTQEVQVQATQGNEQMSQMLDAMSEINESSANISKIIKVIDDIAFQTNILALNAAVEAARAGQYGKGFAVVAEEVRNLAAKSAEAAKDTTALIEGSVHKVDVGTRIANETAQKLSIIAQNVQRCADLVGSIADASNDQATAIAQIDQGLEQVSMVVQTNSATAEESAASSEELSGQANILMQMVGKFKLNDNQIATFPPHNNRVVVGESY